MRAQIGDTGLLSDDTRGISVFQENGIVHRGVNGDGKRILRYEVDGNMIKSAQKRCDYAIGIPGSDKVIFIELKGTDIKHASIQILDTITELGVKLNGFELHARIVCSRIPAPDLRSTQIIKLERKLAQTNGSLIKKCKELEEAI
ncbi:hypothetical protein [Burkholderia vietnamiensis]|uniref:hypothetical protein n=1 Tax=Burkholderia vietnamiensis TaxID=60552 RepID=UPI0012D9E13A|nr:hypothetical protein [Burkholderia vietnamiensis]MBR8146341.1 hypothetical protein [Burkholderia vietnamiensis]HDV6322488.1 hypothetical protein [Burkholderia multivorans]